MSKGRRCLTIQIEVEEREKYVASLSEEKRKIYLAKEKEMEDRCNAIIERVKKEQAARKEGGNQE
jgi:hypothetical protein